MGLDLIKKITISLLTIFNKSEKPKIYNERLTVTMTALVGEKANTPIDQ